RRRARLSRAGPPPWSPARRPRSPESEALSQHPRRTLPCPSCVNSDAVPASSSSPTRSTSTPRAAAPPVSRVRAQTPVPAGSAPAAGSAAGADAPAGADGPGQVGTPSSTSEPRFAGRTATIDRDRDGVELGELSVAEAPDPRPAPRFDGKVLHRPERSGGRSLLWVVWALIAVALIVLIVLMVTGVLGQDSAAAAFPSLDLAAPDLPDLLSDRPVLKEAAT